MLVALADEEKHGYAIIKDVAALTSDSVRLSSGTLYGIIKRLLDDGLVVESRRRPEGDAGGGTTGSPHSAVKWRLLRRRASSARRPSLVPRGSFGSRARGGHDDLA